MNILEMADGIEAMTEGRIEGEKAFWMALAFQQLDAGTYDAEDWVFVTRLGYRIPKSELNRLSGGKHPDYKRQPRRKERDLTIHSMRQLKAAR
jgi:hypothetical protein